MQETRSGWQLKVYVLGSESPLLSQTKAEPTGKREVGSQVEKASSRSTMETTGTISASHALSLSMPGGRVAGRDSGKTLPRQDGKHACSARSRWAAEGQCLASHMAALAEVAVSTGRLDGEGMEDVGD